jgi:hypothetical protein
MFSIFLGLPSGIDLRPGLLEGWGAEAATQQRAQRGRVAVSLAG